MRPTSCIIDSAAIAANVRTLSALVPSTPVCAVVKADGYGHGAVRAARAALAGGATWLAVALVEEAVELREAGIAEPILLLSEPSPTAMEAVVANDLTATIYSSTGLASLGSAAAWASKPVEFHLGVDTGMSRVGLRPDEIDSFLAEVRKFPNLSVAAMWTHCPVADEPDNPFTEHQLESFGETVARIGEGIGDAMSVHVANSAVAITGHAATSGDPIMVRCGISIYGIDPDDALAGMAALTPALTLRSEVSFVKTVEAGTSVGYGHQWTAEHETTIATVPIGYADGVRRDLGLRGGEVLIGGRRCPIVGVVTMDQLMVNVGVPGDGDVVSVGDEVVLIGQQGDEEITAAEIANVLDTIPYEVVCAISGRVPRTDLS